MSVKIKQAITNCLMQIRDKTFDEDTIRTLLIVSRDFIKEEQLLKEFGHFVAHPTRDRGICHNKVNNRYAKLKLVDDQFHKFESDKSLLDNVTTENELSDFLLDAIPIEKIDAKLFEILYFDGINDISEEHLTEYTGFNRADAIKYLRTFYEKKDGWYTLKIIELENKVANDELTVKKYGLDILDEAGKIEVKKILAENEKIKALTVSVRKRINNLQRVIRGTIQHNSIFSSLGLNSEIYSVIYKLIDQFNIDDSFLSVIEDNINDIQLCVMTLLHDATFKFHDGNKSQTYLCFYAEPTDYVKEINLQDYGTLGYAHENGVLALYFTYKTYDKTNSYPLFVSDLKVSDYFDLNPSAAKDNYMFFEPVPYTTAKRINGRLRLILTN